MVRGLSEDCPHVHFGDERQHEGEGSWAGRQAFMRAHVARISSFHGMSGLRDDGIPLCPTWRRRRCFLGSEPLRAFSKRIRVALEHDQRGCGTDVSLRTAPPSQPAGDREEDRFATPEIVEHRGDAVGPSLHGRQRARCDGIGRSGAGLVEEDEPTERCHRLDPALKRRQLGKTSQFVNQGETNTMSRGPSRDVR